ncbi:DUF1028 domain-containing protein [Solihabitans fulvus]|uniref:DUF1028 domain-containing protein n=1 Tax=Solihabitans fulvus TaxID=1892852 RepID=A0A5B2XQC9_9PSEU|nr:DUF1028 domain-containing protein [Solihabitans fulvus]KAA2266138.1 DUF1028 domain-containing protein [Solihabitans fulvus]
MTYSVLARDPETGCFGVAVQSCVLAIGTRVPAARAGVGAVAVQSGSSLRWRGLLLDLLDRGMSADAAVAALRTLPGTEQAQFAAIDRTGSAAAYTGPDCYGDHAGHVVDLDAQFSVQANLMVSDAVWPAMAAAYREAEGGLPERMMAALQAAEREGGDARGVQSAALLVVGPEHGGDSTGEADDEVFDLRVDDSRDPVGDLARLLRTARAHRHLIRIGSLAEEPDRLHDELRAAVALAPDDLTCLLYAISRLGLRGHIEEVRPLLAHAVGLDAAIADRVRGRAEAARRTDNPHAAALLALVDELK